jgi:hypothetical protein
VRGLVALVAIATCACGRIDFGVYAGAGDSGVDGERGDASGDAALVGCAAIQVQLCDDFEAGALASDWSPTTSAGTVTIDGTHVHRGTQALHVHSNATPSATDVNAQIAETATSSASNTQLYVRSFQYLPVIPEGTLVMAVGQSLAPYNGVQLGINAGNLAINDSLVGTYHRSATATLTAGAWHCLELAVDLAAGSQSYAVSLDGAPIADLAFGEATSTSPPTDNVTPGLLQFTPSAAGQVAYDAWVDDVIVDSAPIGCTK